MVVKKKEFTQERILVDTGAVTVAGAISTNSIRGVYRLKATNLYAGKNKLYIDGLKGATATSKDMLRFNVADEVQDWPGYDVTEDSLPFWLFKATDYDHIQLTAENATVEVLITHSDVDH